MKRIAIFVSLLALLGLKGTLVPDAHAWCTPHILHCGDIIDSTVATGSTDISRYSCTGTTNWNGRAHVYKITHFGDSLWIQLDWTGDATHALAIFVLTACDQNTCIATNAHELRLNPPPGDYWIIVDGRANSDYHYELRVYCGDHRLPVELLSFNATDATDGVHLAWSTASETNNRTFRIERQLQDTETWDQVGEVSSHGASATRTDYSYVDASAVGGMRYAYRLLTVDISGNVRELQLVTVTHAAPVVVTPTEFRLVGNYPNPFNPTTQIRFTLAEQSHITLKVFDMVGRAVATLAAGTYDAGTHDVNFDASHLPSGLYVARLSTSRESQMIKMVLLK